MAHPIQTLDARHTGRDSQRAIAILVLDDDAFDRQRLRRLASDFAFPTEVEEAESLFALDEKLDARPYDAILIDYHLAAGDGIDALDIIANHPTNRNAALVMVAGAPQYEVAVQAMKHGCHEFITKVGLNAEDLQKTVLDAVLASTQKTGAVLNQDIEALSDRLANGVMELCLMSIEPKLARMCQNVSVLENHATLSTGTSAALSAIRETCGTLHAFLMSFKEASTPGHEAERIVPIK